jgi:hypothetical protein
MDMKLPTRWIMLAAVSGLVGCAAPGEDDNYRLLDDDEPARSAGEPHARGDVHLLEGDLASDVAAPETSPYEGWSPQTAEAPAVYEQTATANGEIFVNESSTPPPAWTASTDSSEAALTVSVEEAERLTAVQERLITVQEVWTESGTPPDMRDVETFAAAPPAQAELQPQTYEHVVVSSAPADAGVAPVDRSTWPKVTVGPIGGTTHHFPIYFWDVPIHHQDPAVGPGLDHEAALAGGRAGKTDLINGMNLIAQPLKMGADVILLWPRLILDHPIKPQQTP